MFRHVFVYTHCWWSNYSFFDISLRDLHFIVPTYLCFAISLIDLVLCMCHRKLKYTLKNKWRIFIVRLVLNWLSTETDGNINQLTSRTHDFAFWLVVKCKVYSFTPNVFTYEICFCKTLSSSDYHLFCVLEHYLLDLDEINDLSVKWFISCPITGRW